MRQAIAMEPIRYKPAEAIRWLETGAEGMRFVAGAQSKSLIRREGERTIGKDVRHAAGAIADFGKSAIADLLHEQSSTSEYLIFEDRFEIISAGKTKTVRYGEILAIRFRADKATLILERGSITIHPEAYIVSGRIKVPIGWARNDIEVPYEVLIDEISARSGIKIQLE